MGRNQTGIYHIPVIIKNRGIFPVLCCGPGVVVEEGAVVQRALVADGVRIGKGAVVGAADSEHIELVAKRVKGAE